MPGTSVQRRIWEILEAAPPDDRASKACDLFILSLILLNVVAVVVGTVRAVEVRYGAWLWRFEAFSVAVFSAEYLLRLWSCVADRRFAGAVRGRLRYAVHPLAVIDLLAVAPFYLPFIAADLRFVRALRLFRIVRVAKLGRYSASVRLLARVVRDSREELVVTGMVMILLIVMASSFMYIAEHAAQPDQFPHIPAAMWWSVVTLTTVGYGDVYPVTPVGKLFAAVISILGVGMIALPTGIIGGNFVQELQRRKQGKSLCPHCGKELGY